MNMYRNSFERKNEIYGATAAAHSICIILTCRAPARCRIRAVPDPLRSARRAACVHPAFVLVGFSFPDIILFISTKYIPTGPLRCGTTLLASFFQPSKSG